MAKEIICSGGEVILVDDEDFPLLSRHCWHFTTNGAGTRSYAVTRLNTTYAKVVRTVFMHNMILGFGFEVDHIDQNTRDNRKQNLRNATHQKNGWNRGKMMRKDRPCTSKYKGVSYRPLRGKPRWLAMIRHVEPGAHKSTGKTIYIGYFWDEDEAALAYNAKALELRAEWAWLNPVPGKAA